MCDSITCFHENYIFLILINSTQLSEWHPSNKASNKTLSQNHRSNRNSYSFVFFKLKLHGFNQWVIFLKKPGFKYLQYNIKEYDFHINSVCNYKIKILFKSPITNFLSIKVFYAGSQSFLKIKIRQSNASVMSSRWPHICNELNTLKYFIFQRGKDSLHPNHISQMLSQTS